MIITKPFGNKNVSVEFSDEDMGKQTQVLKAIRDLEMSSNLTLSTFVQSVLATADLDQPDPVVLFSQPHGEEHITRVVVMTNEGGSTIFLPDHTVPDTHETVATLLG